MKAKSLSSEVPQVADVQVANRARKVRNKHLPSPADADKIGLFQFETHLCSYEYVL